MKKLIVLLLAVAACSVASTAAKASNIYTCAYAKKISGLGHVYVAFGVSPRYVGPASCTAFNRYFKGQHVPLGRLGTGKAYCRFGYEKKTVTIVAAVYADRASSGRGFCAVFHPGSGWTRI